MDSALPDPLPRARLPVASLPFVKNLTGTGKIHLRGDANDFEHPSHWKAPCKFVYGVLPFDPPLGLPGGLVDDSFCGQCQRWLTKRGLPIPAAVELPGESD